LFMVQMCTPAHDLRGQLRAINTNWNKKVDVDAQQQTRAEHQSNRRKHLIAYR
jgi:hypothetical protein